MQSEPPARREPVFNLPGVVAAAVLVLIAIHVVRTTLLSPELDFDVLLDFAVVPARWTAVWDPAQAGAILREAGADLPSQEAALWRALAQYLLGEGEAKPWTALTYAFLHGCISPVAGAKPEAGAPEHEIEVTPEMVERAMRKLWTYSDVSEYIDRDMMQEILRAALKG
jgi:hypothetical protein